MYVKNVRDLKKGGFARVSSQSRTLCCAPACFRGDCGAMDRTLEAARPDSPYTRVRSIGYTTRLCTARSQACGQRQRALIRGPMAAAPRGPLISEGQGSSWLQASSRQYISP